MRAGRLEICDRGRGGGRRQPVRAFPLSCQAFSSPDGIAKNSHRACATAEQQMTQLHHLETAREDRSSRAAAKRQAIEESKRLAMIDALQRLRQRTEAVLIDLKNAASQLDASIDVGLQNSPT